MPDPNKQYRFAGSLARWMVGAGLWLLIPIVLIFVVPAQKRTFDNFGMQLPVITQLILDVSMWAVEYWWVVAICYIQAAVVAWLITYLVRHRTENRLLMAFW